MYFITKYHSVSRNCEGSSLRIVFLTTFSPSHDEDSGSVFSLIPKEDEKEPSKGDPVTKSWNKSNKGRIHRKIHEKRIIGGVILKLRCLYDI